MRHGHPLTEAQRVREPNCSTRATCDVLTEFTRTREAPTAMGLQCAICERPVAPRPDNPFYPLCSERCRLVDLGKWLGGEYVVAGKPANDFGDLHIDFGEDEL